jgi:hypothetical protein
MATLFEAADNLGKEIKQKRAAAKASEAVEKAVEEKLKAQEDHEKNKKQGMI